MCPFVIYRLKIGIGKCAFKTVALPRQDPTRAPGRARILSTGRAEPRGSPGTMPRAGSVPGVINHQPGPDKRAFPAVLKGPKLRAPGGFSGTVSAVRGIQSVPRPRCSAVPWRGRGVPGASPPSPSAAPCPSARRG